MFMKTGIIEVSMIAIVSKTVHVRLVSEQVMKGVFSKH